MFHAGAVKCVTVQRENARGVIGLIGQGSNPSDQVGFANIVKLTG
jgi:hypothetical protein